MKIRIGFVSNSSSSSSIIRGVKVDLDSIKEMLGQEEFDYPGDMENAFYDMASKKKTNLTLFNCSDEEFCCAYAYVGIDIYSGDVGGFNVLDKDLAKLTPELDKKILDGVKKLGLQAKKLETIFLYKGAC